MKRKFFLFFAAILIESAVCCFLTGFQGGPKHQSEQELAYYRIIHGSSKIYRAV